jgi:hypothetical protein
MSLTIISKLYEPKKIPINEVLTGSLFLKDNTSNTEMLCMMCDRNYDYIELSSGYVFDYEHYPDTLVELVNVTITIDSYEE